MSWVIAALTQKASKGKRKRERKKDSVGTGLWTNNKQPWKEKKKWGLNKQAFWQFTGCRDTFRVFGFVTRAETRKIRGNHLFKRPVYRVKKNVGWNVSLHQAASMAISPPPSPPPPPPPSSTSSLLSLSSIPEHVSNGGERGRKKRRIIMHCWHWTWTHEEGERGEFLLNSIQFCEAKKFGGEVGGGGGRFWWEEVEVQSEMMEFFFFFGQD